MKQFTVLLFLLLLKASCYGFSKPHLNDCSAGSIRQRTREQYFGSGVTAPFSQRRIQQRFLFSPSSFRLTAIPLLPLEGIALGLAWAIIPSWVRIASAERAWEERLAKARQKREEESGEKMSNIEFYQKSVSTYPTMYGPDGTLERKRRAALKKKRKDENLDMEEYKEEEDTTVVAEERLAFEKEFGLEYDPDYDEPLLEEELPTDLKFVKLSAYGDRMYEDGRVFFKDGDVYFRRGAYYL